MMENDSAWQDADRRVLEEIVGHPLDDEWPEDAMPVGTRVRVIKDPEWDGPWQQVFLGTIDATFTPAFVAHKLARPGEREYSVAFESPQQDADECGPYRKTVIWERYLERV